MGDDAGLVHLYSASSLEVTRTLKAVYAKPISTVIFDEILNILFSSGDTLSIFDKQGVPVANFTLNVSKFGKIIDLKDIREQVVVATEQGHFFVFDSLKKKEEANFKATNWTLSGLVTVLISNTSSVSNFGATDQGEIFVYDIN